MEERLTVPCYHLPTQISLTHHLCNNLSDTVCDNLSDTVAITCPTLSVTSRTKNSPPPPAWFLPPQLRVVFQRPPHTQGIASLVDWQESSSGGSGAGWGLRGKGGPVGLVWHQVDDEDGDVIVAALLTQRPAGRSRRSLSRAHASQLGSYIQKETMISDSESSCTVWRGDAEMSCILVMGICFCDVCVCVESKAVLFRSLHALNQPFDCPIDSRTVQNRRNREKHKA